VNLVLLAVVIASVVLAATDETLLSLAPKSATAPVAMAVSEQLGGAPSLTAVLTILTGITGVVCGGAVLNLVRVGHSRARGLAIGVVAHGIGTAHKMQVHPTSGAFAGWDWRSTPSRPRCSFLSSSRLCHCSSGSGTRPGAWRDATRCAGARRAGRHEPLPGEARHGRPHAAQPDRVGPQVRFTQAAPDDAAPAGLR